MSELDMGLHYPINIKRLPSGWKAGYINSFAVEIESGFACGKHNSDGQGVDHLRPMNINRKGEIELVDIRSVPAFYNDKRLREGDVLFNNTNSPELIGKTAFVDKKVCGKAFSNHMTRVRFKEFVDPRFAALQLHYLWMMKYYMHRCVKHVNQASISARDLSKSVPIIIPPLNIQHNIVAKIETLFSELDKGIESLKTARQQLKAYRQAVLKHAFEGKLTEQWRQQNPDKLASPEQLLTRIQQEREQRYQQQLEDWKQAVKAWEQNGKEGKKPGRPKKLDSQQISSDIEQSTLSVPKEWAWRAIGEYFSVFVGATPSRRQSAYWGGDIPWVSSGEVAFSDIGNTQEKITESGYINASTEVHPPGTVMLAMIGEGKTRGQAAILRISAAHNQNTAAIRVSETDFIPEYIYYFFYFQYEITRMVGAGNNQKALNKKRVSDIRFPVCGIEEQKEMLKILEAKLSQLEAMEEEIDIQIARSEVLRQCILKKAFSGQLVTA